ncbi:acetyltransferase [Mangrovibacter phragmitis]|jgi:putative acetyltransferase|uniref:Acetyltransferase n=1 Tax=Mangrovibacter phragmitis TaxID=1691903 RepID=A0A1B7L3V7_9ENTR|nr:N-acetyltransferase [Mangrovibacter phragmitis]OAT77089.1 acetyltransferase [Mangrovibacter phragmitis]
MIRRSRARDMPELLSLWLASTTAAHEFIPVSYWQASVPVVRDIYLPHATTWVYHEQGELQGFVSVLESRFIGALFIAPHSVGHGIGRELLSHVKHRYPLLSLEVYQKNSRAVSFYHAQGFRIIESAWQDDTQEPTWIMSWQAG